MSVMQEMIVVVIYIVAGIALPRQVKEPRLQTETRWSRGRTRLAGGVKRFTAFLERPKAFIRRLKGLERVVSKEQAVFNDFYEGK
jgi:hypothetical protein